MEGFHSPPNTEKNCVVNSFDVMAYQDMNIYIYIHIYLVNFTFFFKSIAYSQPKELAVPDYQHLPPESSGSTPDTKGSLYNVEWMYQRYQLHIYVEGYKIQPRGVITITCFILDKLARTALHYYSQPPHSKSSLRLKP